MICIPVIASTNEDALGHMKKCFPLADMVELRIDYIENVNLEMLLSSRTGTVMVTNRKKGDGGHFAGGEEERVSLLGDAAAMGADFVDIELSTDDALIDHLLASLERDGGQTRLIVSYHDFRETPSDRKLRRLLTESMEKGADIVKIVTFARSAGDNLRILHLIGEARRLDCRIIAFCMGKGGKISRVMAPFFGSYLTFASLEEGAESAPGQMTVHEMKTIFRILNDEN